MIALLRELSGTTLPPHLEWIEQIIAYSVSFVLIIMVMRVVTLFVDRRR